VNNPDYKGLSISRSILKFYKTQGLKGLFKGNSAALIRIFPFSAIEFFSFEFYKNAIIREYPHRNNSIYYTFICGALAGLNAITFTFPLDVVRTRLACQTANSHIHDTHLFKALFDLYKTQGVRGLYKGYSIVFAVSKYFSKLKRLLSIIIII